MVGDTASVAGVETLIVTGFALQLPREQTPEACRDFAIFDPYLRHFLKIRVKRETLGPKGCRSNGSGS